MPDTSPDYLLEMRDLKLHFFTGEGVVKAVDGASYAIRWGKTLCVVGESGCGKSVAARAILQIVHRPGKIIDGKITYHRRLADDSVQSVDITALHPRGAAIRDIRGNEIAMIFQEPMTSLSSLYTVGNQIVEAIQLHNRVSKYEARQRAIDLLAKVGIPQPEVRIDEYPFRLSGGMRQRCMIAMALSCRPKLLIADEAISALDVSIRAQILNLLEDLQAELGLTYLFIAHDLSVIRHICNRVNVMYVGKLVESAEATALYTHPQHPYTEALMSAVPIHNPRLRNRERRIRLEGDVADPANPPSGCYFHPRCRYAQERCQIEEPALRLLESRPGEDPHFVACHFAEELNLRGVIAGQQTPKAKE